MNDQQPSPIDTNSFKKYSASLPFIIKKYDFSGALSKEIHEGDSSKAY